MLGAVEGRLRWLVCIWRRAALRALAFGKELSGGNVAIEGLCCGARDGWGVAVDLVELRLVGVGAEGHGGGVAAMLEASGEVPGELSQRGGIQNQFPAFILRH